MNKTLRLLSMASAFSVAALWLAPAPAAADGPFQFHSLTPCRVVNTRNNTGTTGGAVASNATRSFTIQGACGVPAGAKAVALNVTIASPTNTGHLTLWPAGTTLPTVSTINYNAGEPALANGAIVPLGTSTPDLSARPFLAGGGTVDLILDVTGYFM
ncbi:MAG TPA: hypothetical protein VEL74_07980 [Thermoanaerobaculia bacterium]|nr:hypothetical protein [Thermoanaerobaculia bacterium]